MKLVSMLLVIGCTALLGHAQIAQAQVVGVLRDGVYRFDLDEQSRASAPPTVVFVDPAAREAMRPVQDRPPSVIPSLAVADGRFIVSITGEPGTTYYGGSLGQHRFARNGLELSPEGRPLPWAIGVRRDGTAFGLLVDGPAPDLVSFDEGIRIETEGPARPVILIDAPHPALAAMSLQQTVGSPTIPEKWTFGVHHVLPDGLEPEQVIAIADSLRARDVPGDVLWLPSGVADESLAASVAARGFHLLSLDDRPTTLNAPASAEQFAPPTLLGPDRTLLGWERAESSADAIATTLSLGLSGFPFFGASPADDATNTRSGWLDAGPMLPLAFGLFPADGVIDEATQRTLLSRMVLLPHIYSAAYQAHQVGLPIARPIMFEHITTPELRGFTDAFMLGNGLAVSRTSEPFDPGESTWRRFDLRDAFGGTPPVPGEPTLWLGAGHMVATGPMMERVDEAPPEPLTIYINLDAKGQANGYLYEDAGVGAGYTEQGSLLTIYGARRTPDGQLQVLRLGDQGERQRYARTLRAIWLTDDGWFLGEGLDGTPLVIDPEAAVRVGP